jgi:hypothetical protein
MVESMVGWLAGARNSNVFVPDGMGEGIAASVPVGGGPRAYPNCCPDCLARTCSARTVRERAPPRACPDCWLDHAVRTYSARTARGRASSRACPGLLSEARSSNAFSPDGAGEGHCRERARMPLAGANGGPGVVRPGSFAEEGSGSECARAAGRIARLGRVPPRWLGGRYGGRSTANSRNGKFCRLVVGRPISVDAAWLPAHRHSALLISGVIRPDSGRTSMAAVLRVRTDREGVHLRDGLPASELPVCCAGGKPSVARN